MEPDAGTAANGEALPSLCHIVARDALLNFERASASGEGLAGDVADGLAEDFALGLGQAFAFGEVAPAQRDAAKRALEAPMPDAMPHPEQFEAVLRTVAAGGNPLYDWFAFAGRCYLDRYGAAEAKEECQILVSRVASGVAPRFALTVAAGLADAVAGGAEAGSLEWAVDLHRTAREALIAAVRRGSGPRPDAAGGFAEALRGATGEKPDALLEAFDVSPRDLGIAPTVTAIPPFDEVPVREWLVRDWLPTDTVGLLSGQGGIGKSRLALQLAYCLATGDPEWLPGATAGGQPFPRAELPEGGLPVCYWTAEDGLDELHRRLYRGMACGKGHDLLATRHVLRTPDFASGNWLAVNGIGAGPLWGPAHGAHVSTRPAATAHGEWLLETARAHGARLLVIDTAAAAYGSNENERSLVREFVNWLAAWGAAWGRESRCAILIVSHPPKSAAAYSGSTDWVNGARYMWTVAHRQIGEHGSNGEREETAPALELHKSNYANPAAPRLAWLDFRLADGELGQGKVRARGTPLTASPQEEVRAKGNGKAKPEDDASPEPGNTKFQFKGNL